jgi:hypothetical protein
VEKHRRRIFPKIPRQTIAIPQLHPHIRPPGHVHVRGPGFPPPRARPCPRTPPPARPRGSQGRHEARGRDGRPDSSPPPDSLPAPWPHAGRPKHGGGRVGFRGTVVSRRGMGTQCHGPHRGRAGGCPWPVAGMLLRLGGSCEVHYTPPVLLHVILLEKYLCVWGGRLPDLHAPLSTRAACTSDPNVVSGV